MNMVISEEKCYICSEVSPFEIVDGATLLREAKCLHCGASIRNSDTARIIIKALLNSGKALSESIAELRGLHVLEAASYGPIHEILRKLNGYKFFEYFRDTPSGKYENGILSNDLQDLSFHDNSFDLIITQDVFEHIIDPIKAFHEIRRVLRLGGHHVFTVPLHENRRSISRRKLREVYHGDPLSDGILVQNDWGFDIVDIIDGVGMRTSRYDLHMFYRAGEVSDVDREYDDYLVKEHVMFFRYNSIVFDSVKIK